jgi:hypothetical protein
MSNAVLWQHVFQVVVCVLGAVQRVPAKIKKTYLCVVEVP